MKKTAVLSFVFVSVLVTAALCAAAPAQEKPPQGQSGKVIETMNSGGYTYVHVDTGKEKIWAAAPEVKVKVGDDVTLSPGVPMKNFKSKTLNRTFDVVYFVGSISVGGAAVSSGAAEGGGIHQGKTTATAPEGMDFSGIKKPAGAKTVAEVFAESKKLSGKPVTVCGKVVKFSANIMGKNWLHVQDGTGASGTNDLTVTSQGTAKTGDVVTASGVLALDRDLGHGYKYEVIIEDAKLKIQ